MPQDACGDGVSRVATAGRQVSTHVSFMQIRALAERQQWDALDAFSHERKAPVGLEAFITAARAHGAPAGVLARCECPCWE